MENIHIHQKQSDINYLVNGTINRYIGDNMYSTETKTSIYEPVFILWDTTIGCCNHMNKKSQNKIFVGDKTYTLLDLKENIL